MASLAVSLGVDLCGLKLRNPIMTASGSTSHNASALIKAAEHGAGGLVTKTMSIEASETPRPNLAKVEGGIINAESWSGISHRQWISEEFPKLKETGLPLIASIGYTAEEVVEIAPKVAEAGVGAVEICMNKQELSVESLAGAVKAAKEATEIPVFAKLSAQVPSIVKAAKTLEENGADAIVAIDAVGPCMAFEVENAMPLMGSPNGYGWLSGPVIKPLAVRCVSDIARNVEIPVIGAGGVSNSRDALEFIMAGATAVELCTSAIIRGAEVYGRIADEMTRFMRSRNHTTIDAFRGTALKHLPDEEDAIRTKVPELEVLKSKCTGCRLCVSCPYGAIRMIGGLAKIDVAKCTGCGLCVSICPPRAIRY